MRSDTISLRSRSSWQHNYNHNHGGHNNSNHHNTNTASSIHGCSLDDLSSVDSATTSTTIPSSNVAGAQNSKGCLNNSNTNSSNSSKTNTPLSERYPEQIGIPCASVPSSTADENSSAQHFQSKTMSSNTSTQLENRRASTNSNDASSSRIRSRYLQRLGVVAPHILPSNHPQQQQQARKKITPLPANMILPSSTSVRRRRSDSIEALKSDHGKKDDTLALEAASAVSSPVSVPSSPIASSSSISSSSSSSSSLSVRFQPYVRVHSIPHRSEYSSRVKRTLWMPPMEIEQMITRNAIEFAAEGWDWRRAAEEEDFILLDNKEWIHPAHVMRRCNMQRQFLMVMSARQQQRVYR